MGSAAPSPRRQQSRLPEWTQERLPPIEKKFVILPIDLVQKLLRKLDGHTLAVAMTIALKTYGEQFDRRYGVDPKPHKKGEDVPRPKWTPLPKSDLADLICSTLNGIDPVLEEMTFMGAEFPKSKDKPNGLLLKQKIGRMNWYALNLEALERIPDRKPREERKAKAEPEVEETDQPAAGDRLVVMPNQTSAPRPLSEVVRGARQWSYANRTEYPLAVAPTVEGGILKLLIEHVTDSPISVLQPPLLHANGKNGKNGYGVLQHVNGTDSTLPNRDYTLAQFDRFIDELWTEFGLSRIGYSTEDLNRKAFENGKGASLTQWRQTIELTIKAGRFKRPGLLPHLGDQCAREMEKFDADEQRKAALHEGIAARQSQDYAERDAQWQESMREATATWTDLLPGQKTAMLRIVKQRYSPADAEAEAILRLIVSPEIFTEVLEEGN